MSEMWKVFKEGYEAVNGPPSHVLVGRMFGLWFKCAACTAVVVLTARALGVAV